MSDNIHYVNCSKMYRGGGGAFEVATDLHMGLPLDFYRIDKRAKGHVEPLHDDSLWGQGVSDESGQAVWVFDWGESRVLSAP